ncbi:MAG: diguanylate cyclase domain-containing protein [Alphaproteobacteria bacterium]
MTIATIAPPEVPAARPRVLVAAHDADHARRWADLAHRQGYDSILADPLEAERQARLLSPDCALMEAPCDGGVLSRLALGTSEHGPLPVTLLEPALMGPGWNTPLQDITDPVRSLPNPFDAEQGSPAALDAMERHIARRLDAMMRLHAMVDEWTRRHAVLTALGHTPAQSSHARDLIDGADRTVLVAGEPGPDYARIEALCADRTATVVGAFTPAMTVDYLARHAFDVLILTASSDLEAYLPVVSAVRRNPRLIATPILVTADPGAHPEVAGALRTGVTDILLRSLSDDDFAARIRTFLTESTMRRVLKGVLDAGPPAALRDEETGLAGAAFCEAQLERMTAETHATRRAWSLVLFDLGQAQCEDGSLVPTESRVFFEAASVIAAMARAQDFKARPGERELLILMPQTPRAQAHDVARRLGGALASARFGGEGEDGGVVVMARHTVLSPRLGTTVGSMLIEARQRLRAGLQPALKTVAALP